MTAARSFAYNLSMLLSLMAVCCMAYIGKGNELMQAERYSEAAEQFRLAITGDKTLAVARKSLAICDFKTRNYQEAGTLFNSLKSGPDHIIATYYLGRLDLNDGKFDRAISRLESLKTENPETIDARYFLGVAFMKKEKYREAIQKLRAYIGMNERDFRAHQALARCLLKIGSREEADREFARTRELHAYYTEGSVTIGACRTLLAQGKGDEAWDRCKPLLDTDDVDKIAAVGLLFGQMNDSPHALAAWETALRLDPGSPEINYNLAFAYFQTHDLTNSREYARKAYELWPDFPEASILYGTVLYMTGPDSEAERVLKHAHLLLPDDTNIVQLLSSLRSRQN